MENIYSEKSFGFSKSVFIIALIIGFFINLLILASFQYYISNFKQEIKPKKIKITYIPEKPKPAQKNIKRKKKKQVKKTIKEKRKVKKNQKSQEIKQKNKTNISKPKKATGEKVEKKPAIPAVTPPLPEKVELDEEKINLPEEELAEGDFVDVPSENVVIKEFKAVSPGKFNPSFGTEFSKLDTSVKGTAKSRKIIYKPSPPTVRASIPPPSIKVKLWINPDGTVSSVQLLETTGNPEIDKKVKEYILSWKFNKIDSKEKQWAITTIKFKNK